MSRSQHWLKRTKNLALSNLIKLFSLFLSFVPTLVVFLGFAYLAARSPEFHGYLIREKVGSKVYTVRGSPVSGGGTGFSIKAKSGTTYIVSNAHVCELSLDKQRVFVSDNEGRSMWRRILEITDYSDLCLIEGMPGVEGLSLGTEPNIGQIVAAVGHPSLMPITLSRGEIISPDNIEIVRGVIVDPDDPEGEQVKMWISSDMLLTTEQCSLPKNKILTVKIQNVFLGEQTLKLCLDVVRGAYRTNMLIQPGNSGSPVVNFWGNVVGVVFASDRYNWGILVSFEDLERLLSSY